jgi:hypothetical protein
MKNNIIYSTLGIFAVVIVVLIFDVNTLKSENAALKKETQSTVHTSESEEEIEVADYMNKLQRFSDKLYFSGKAGNEELVEFYLHEMEEAMEEVHEANAMEDGVDVSKMMDLFGLQRITHFRKELQKGTEFEGLYDQLVSNCNTCHVSTKHPYIVIKTPTSPAFTNQVFEKDSL